MLYVIDEQGKLIDDIRVREFLLAPPDRLVTQIMDNRFVALCATNAAETAVTVFLAEDRKALPVTDSAGILIGIVTIDDVLKLPRAVPRRKFSASVVPRRWMSHICQPAFGE